MTRRPPIIRAVRDFDEISNYSSLATEKEIRAFVRRTQAEAIRWAAKQVSTDCDVLESLADDVNC